MKRNLLLSIALVMVVALLCGCGGKEKTNTNNGGNGGSTNNTSKSDSLAGVYVAADDFYLETLVIIDKGDKYGVLIKDFAGLSHDTVKKSSVKDNTITSSIFSGEYTVKLDGSAVTFNSEGMAIENFKMNKSTGALDGIYKNDTGYLVVATLKTGSFQVTHLGLEDNAMTSTLKFDNANISGNKFTKEDISGAVAVNLTKEDKLNAQFNDKKNTWNAYSGQYSLVK